MKNIRGYLYHQEQFSCFSSLKIGIAPLYKTLVGSPPAMALSDTVINGSWIIAEPVSYLLTGRITGERELAHESSPLGGRCLPPTSPTICASACQFIFQLFTEVQTCQNGFLSHNYVEES